MATRAQKLFLKEHINGPNASHHRKGQEDGFRPRAFGYGIEKTYDFIARARDAGLIEIVEHDPSVKALGFPYAWKGTRITDAGRKVLA